MVRLMTPTSVRPHVLLRYAAAIGSVVLALVLSIAIFPFITANPFILFFAAIAFSAWYSGFSAGILTSLLSVIVVNYALIPPYDAFSIGLADVVRAAIFIVVATFISTLNEARRRAELRFAVTLRSIGDGVIATDIHGRITMMNPVAEALTGWTEAAAFGKEMATVFQIINATTRQPVEIPIARVLRDGVTTDLANHTLLIARDGTERPIDDTGAPIRTDDGTMVGAVLVFRDSSTHVQAEQERTELLRREQAARVEAEAARTLVTSVLTRVTDAFIALDTQLRYTYVNDQAMTLLQHTRAELIGKQILEVFPEAEQSFPYQTMHDALTSREAATVMYHSLILKRKYTMRVYPDTDGLTVYFQDITQEQKAKAAHERAVERLSRLQAVTAALSGALTPADVAAVIVEQCSAAFDIAGIVVGLVTPDGTALEIVGASGYPVEMVEQFRRIPLTTTTPMNDSVRAKVPSFIGSRAEARQLWSLADSVHQLIDIHAWANIPLMHNGEAIGALDLGFRQERSFSANDRAFLMTLGDQCAQAMERARLYAAEQRARAEAEDAVRLRDQFLSVAAHELKTPLTAIQANTQLLERRLTRDTTLSERDQRTLRVINEQVTRLNNMILGLLDASRLEQGQLQVVRAPLDICQLIRSVIEEGRVTDPERIITLNCPPEALLVNGDSVRLEQVMNNLLQNAIKYSSPSTPIEVTVTQETNRVAVTFQDHGIGIPQAALPQLFQRFYRADNVHTTQISGTGIGLYVVKEIVTLHGGSVDVDSTEGVGSRFTVYLPLVEDETAV